jgi:hypothetical protein
MGKLDPSSEETVLKPLSEESVDDRSVTYWCAHDRTEDGITSYGSPYCLAYNPRRYRIARSYRFDGSPPFVELTAPCDHRIDGVYCERHAFLPYYSMGGAMDIYKGTLSLWIKPNFHPEFNHQVRTFVDMGYAKDYQFRPFRLYSIWDTRHEDSDVFFPFTSTLGRYTTSRPSSFSFITVGREVEIYYYGMATIKNGLTFFTGEDHPHDHFEVMGSMKEDNSRVYGFMSNTPTLNHNGHEGRRLSYYHTIYSLNRYRAHGWIHLGIAWNWDEELNTDFDYFTQVKFLSHGCPTDEHVGKPCPVCKLEMLGLIYFFYEGPETRIRGTRGAPLPPYPEGWFPWKDVDDPISMDTATFNYNRIFVNGVILDDPYPTRTGWKKLKKEGEIFREEFDVFVNQIPGTDKVNPLRIGGDYYCYYTKRHSAADSTLDELYVFGEFSVDDILTTLWGNGRYYKGGDPEFSSGKIDLGKLSGGKEVFIFGIAWTAYEEGISDWMQTMVPGLEPVQIPCRLELSLSEEGSLINNAPMRKAWWTWVYKPVKSFRYHVRFSIQEDLNTVLLESPIFDEIRIYWKAGAPVFYSWILV